VPRDGRVKMAKPNVETLLDLLRRSGLVETDQLNRMLLEIGQQSEGAALTDVDLLAAKLVDGGLITRWQADRLLEGRYKGFFLGKYKLLGQIGRGGMSQVYLAEHVLMQRRVAIKVLPKDRVNDSSYLARFYREAEAVAKLDHRNIVRAYDVDNENATHYLVMEFFDGRDLQQVARQDGPLPYALAADYIRQAAEGLQHAHGAGLIHRDVKPANLLVDQKGCVKVLDLGLARLGGDDHASLTVAYDETVLGTADYLPPEQAVNSHRVDSRADIYSLGCTLYYLLTGHPPFPDGNLPQRLMAHQKQAPPDIRIDRPDAPDDLIQICLKMMAKRPEQRYQTARDVALALDQWLVAHGHKAAIETTKLGSGAPSAASGGMRTIRGGSAGNLPGRDAAAVAREPKSRPDVVSSKPGSSTKLPRTSALAPPSSSPPGALADTIASFDPSTVKGTPSESGGGLLSDARVHRSVAVSGSPNLIRRSQSVLDLEVPPPVGRIPSRSSASSGGHALAGSGKLWLWAVLVGGILVLVAVIALLVTHL
jgi:eukaryotic-like serine/threonine-protein kinase